MLLRSILCLFACTQLFLGRGLAQTNSVTIAVIGDYGGASLDNRAATDERAVSDLVKSWNPDFVMTVGDNNYGSAAAIDTNIGQFFHEFIYPYTGIFGPGATTNRFFPSLGNHDLTNAHLAYFTLPGNERYYNYRYGLVEIFALNSEPGEPHGNTNGSVQAQWLQSQLGASTAKWKLVYFHRPPYSSGFDDGSYPAMRWPFAEWGATAVLCGHEHNYERIHTNGIVYFVNGLGGVSRYTFGTNIIAGSAVRFNGDFGAMRLDATEGHLRFRFITRARVVIDSYSIVDAAIAEPPAILQDPTNQLVFRGSNAMLRVEAGGHTTTFSYQWLFNGEEIEGATNSTLMLAAVQPSQEGYYSVRVANSIGSILSDAAYLTVVYKPYILEQPQNRGPNVGQTATFSVSAIGEGVLRYQWLFEGTNIVGATNSSLVLTNVQLSQQGFYWVLITNDAGSVFSEKALLTVYPPPIITVQPLSQTAAEGGAVTFSGAGTGILPFTVEWYRNGNPFRARTVDERTFFLTLTNVQTNHAGAWRFQLRSFFGGPAVEPSSNAMLTVLSDRDRDGAPDAWETAFGFDPDNGLDGIADLDGDGAGNADEFVAGTNPTNAQSVLRIQTATIPGSSNFSASFVALSNRTYSLQERTGLTGVWQVLSSFPAVPSNDLFGTVIPATNALRLYRATTPAKAP